MKPGLHADGNGLYLKVDKSGARRWIQRIVIRGDRKEIAIGSTSLVSLSSAREAARHNRRIARAGGDPLEEKRKQQGVPTFETAAREVHKANLSSWQNRKHAAQFIRTLETYTFPFFGQRPVSEVGGSDLLAALLPIWTEKPETARRVHQRVGSVFKWAMAKGWRVDNPAEAVRAVLPKHDRTSKKHRKALPYSDVADCLDEVRASGADPSTKLAVEFLVLNASRSIEVREARWAEFDLETCIWSIPAQRMKMRKKHEVPLVDRAVEILHEARSLHSGNLVFSGSRTWQATQ